MNEKYNILIIDDEAVIRDGCTRILQKEGWNVKSAEKGLDGLDLIKNESFDILLLDLMMPGMSGLDVIAELKKLSSDIYIIVITGYATIETAVEAMRKGAFDYVSKPFTPEQLRMVVLRAIENKELHLETEFLRKEQEKGLQKIAQEKSKIRTILDCMPNGVLVIDSDMKIALNNPMARQLLKIESAETVGMSIVSCIDCSALTDAVSCLINSSTGESGRTSIEIDETDMTPMMAHIAPVSMGVDLVIGVVIILQDISAQKLMDRMKADFIAKVTHELKTPAATINQLLMTLQSEVVGDLEDEQKKLIGRAKNWGETLLELVSDLLNISKIESGMAIQNFAPVQISEIVEQVIELIKPQADIKNIKIITSYNNSQTPVYADRNGLKDVFTNLIGNAVKYSEEGKDISIIEEIDNNCMKVIISDKGFGISSDELPHIFERFYRVKNSKTRRILGTGLGLPIVKEVIDYHNGQISVESEEGKGSKFTIVLPLDNININ